MYSLISAPVLGFDLARLAGGAATAEILVAAMGLSPWQLGEFADHLPPDSADLIRARSAARRAAAERRAVRDLPHEEPHRALALLERAPIGSLDALLHCLRTDVLGLPADGAGVIDGDARVAAVLADAVSASYLRDLLSDVDRRVLAANWLAMRRRIGPHEPDLGPQRRSLERLLRRVATLSAAEVRALHAVADRVRSGGANWPSAMHSITWGVYLADRVRPAAVAQFLLVQAVDLAGMPVADRAAGVWNMLSGTVAALVVRDLADSDSAHELLVPCLSALGPGWLAPA